MDEISAILGVCGVLGGVFGVLALVADWLEDQEWAK